jgi:pyruvate formate lyase activating enzyme
MKEAVLYKNFKGSIVRCIACNHYCVIENGEAGKCGIRKNEKGKLFLLTYGRPSAVNIDPIEKKPLFHFLPGTQVFSFGTFGCNFGCKFCQNWQLSQSPKGGALKGLKEFEQVIKKENELQPEEILKIVKRDKIPSIAYTYNEPTTFFEYAYDTALLAKKAGVKNIFVSNGFMSPEQTEYLVKILDAINIDLKSFSEKFYEQTCGARLKPVLENIEKFKRAEVWVELTTLLIPGKNDSPQELAKMAKFIAGIDKSIPWHLSRFHPDYHMMEYQPTSQEKLLEAHSIAKNAGLDNVYIGNWASEKYESTYCPNCDKVVVKRVGYSIKDLIKNGKCPNCKYKIEGVWK